MCCNQNLPADVRTIDTLKLDVLESLPTSLISEAVGTLSWQIQTTMLLQNVNAEYRIKRIDPDGTLEYVQNDSQPPPDILGYNRSSDNLWLFTPAMAPCSARMSGVNAKRNGLINLTYLCNHTDADYYAKTVGPEQCNGCPLRDLNEKTPQPPK